MSRLILLSSLFLFLVACGSKSPAPESVPATPAPVVARIDLPVDTIMDIHLPADTAQSYIIYNPSGNHDANSAPVIVFFDPHGSGRLPVEKYRQLADQFAVVLVGSNNSKNGQQITESSQIANNIITDLSTRMGYKASNICLAGFSGGAKVALNTTINNQNINNAIYSGASIPFNATHPVHLLGFAGTEDMNYSDLLQFHSILTKGNPDAGVLVEWRGKHEWPDAETYRKAFYWLCFERYRANTLRRDSTLIAAYKKETDRAIASDMNEDAQIEAYDECRTAVAMLKGVADASAYEVKMKAIAAGRNYQAQLNLKNQTLQNEGSEKQMLLAAFQKEDGNWWTKTINRYKASGSPSDKRLLGFVSLACYSYAGQLLTRRDTANAGHVLAIYELADAGNTDQMYFHAILYSMEDHPEAAIAYLQKAVSKGFNDWQKIESEPAFTPLRGYESFSRLLTSLKKAPR